MPSVEEPYDEDHESCAPDGHDAPMGRGDLGQLLGGVLKSLSKKAEDDYLYVCETRRHPSPHPTYVECDIFEGVRHKAASDSGGFDAISLPHVSVERMKALIDDRSKWSRFLQATMGLKEQGLSSDARATVIYRALGMHQALETSGKKVRLTKEDPVVAFMPEGYTNFNERASINEAIERQQQEDIAADAADPHPAWAFPTAPTRQALDDSRMWLHQANDTSPGSLDRRAANENYLLHSIANSLVVITEVLRRRTPCGHMHVSGAKCSREVYHAGKHQTGRLTW